MTPYRLLPRALAAAGVVAGAGLASVLLSSPTGNAPSASPAPASFVATAFPVAQAGFARS